MQSQPSPLLDLNWIPFRPIALAFFVIYAASTVAGALPLQLLNPNWQLRMVTLLVDQAPLALIGFALVHLEAFVAPQPIDASVRRQLNILANVAVVPTLVYLLLIPIQLVNATMVSRGLTSRMHERVAVVERDFRTLRSKILAPSTSKDTLLQLQLRGSPPLTPAERDLPLARLRPRFLERLNVARGDAIRLAEEPFRPKIYGLITVSLRNILCAAAVSIAFAAEARLRGSCLTLLEELMIAKRAILGRFNQRPQEQTDAEDREYYDLIEGEPNILNYHTQEEGEEEFGADAPPLSKQHPSNRPLRQTFDGLFDPGFNEPFDQPFDDYEPPPRRRWLPSWLPVPRRWR